VKKIIFIVVMLFAATCLFSDPMIDDAKSLLEKSELVYQDFQVKYKTLKNYDTTKRSKDALKELVDMINRYKKLVEDKFVEIDGMEKTGKPVPANEFDQLKSLIERYHEMTVNLANWINTR
jgi:hypothetical protein